MQLNIFLASALIAAQSSSLITPISVFAADDELSGGRRKSTRFDYHTVRGRATKADVAGLFEGELHLRLQGRSRAQGMRHYGSAWSGDAHLLWDGTVGESMETTFRMEQGGRYRLFMQLTMAPDYGIFTVYLNGKELRKGIDLFSRNVRLAERLALGEVTVEAGEQKLVFTLTGGNERASKFRGKGYLMGLDFVQLRDVRPAPQVYERPTVARSDAIERSLPPFKDIAPLLAQYCHRCHGAKELEGEVDLRKLATRADFLANIELTRKVANALRRHEMPPQDEKQLPDKQHQQLALLFETLVDEYAQTGTLAPVVMRRLNRYEYNNTVRDLLELKGDVYPLPEKVIRAGRPYFDPASGRFPDAVQIGNRALGKNQIEQKILTGVSPFAIDLQAEHGFNNRGEELSVSPVLLESFLKLGQAIVHSPEFDAYCGLTASLFSAPPGEPVADPLQVATARLRPFLERAFRHPVEEETVRRYSDFFVRELKRTNSFSYSMKQVVAGILASPRFLYLREATVPPGKRSVGQAGPTQDSTSQPLDAHELDAHELATRLSYFLWSSMPDDELFALARSNQLLETEVIRAQVDRMLLDRRSQALSVNFARQWLRLDQLITAVPDFDRFQVYYSRIGCEQWKFGLQAMIEPLLLFESIMVEDRSIMLLVDSNYSYRSDELQSWYSDPVPFKNRQNRNRFNTFSQAFRRRPLDTRRQGGVITSAAVLTMTSSPLRTSPITRGAWFATVVFNQPPPPPPDVVPPIEADDAVIEAKGLTLRARLKQHQVNQSCAACHSKIDPLGFALENFDAIGRWRDKYRSGLAIDASGKLFGQVEFSDVVGLKEAILEHPEWFMRAFSEHLLSYGLGRSLVVTDKPAVDHIVHKVRAKHGQFSTVVMQVATSYPFRHKTGQQVSTAEAGDRQ